MDEGTLVLILGVVVIVLGAVEVVRTQAQSLLAWAAVVAGVALVLLAT